MSIKVPKSRRDELLEQMRAPEQTHKIASGLLAKEAEKADQKIVALHTALVGVLGRAMEQMRAAQSAHDKALRAADAAYKSERDRLASELAHACLPIEAEMRAEREALLAKVKATHEEMVEETKVKVKVAPLDAEFEKIADELAAIKSRR